MINHCPIHNIKLDFIPGGIGCIQCQPKLEGISDMPFKGLRVTTEHSLFFLEWDGLNFKIRETTCEYLKTLILGRIVRRPKELLPLTIFLNFNDELQTSRVTKIEEIR